MVRVQTFLSLIHILNLHIGVSPWANYFDPPVPRCLVTSLNTSLTSTGWERHRITWKSRSKWAVTVTFEWKSYLCRGRTIIAFLEVTYLLSGVLIFLASVCDYL